MLYSPFGWLNHNLEPKPPDKINVATFPWAIYSIPISDKGSFSEEIDSFEN